jgi:NAD(P)-dependent dehydrogenase (short-subunit alcohol dehydrogenase family)
MSGSAALDPKPAFAAVAATKAAKIALAKVFAEQGIKDGAQVNGIIRAAVMTGRRPSPKEAGIRRYGVRSLSTATLTSRLCGTWPGSQGSTQGVSADPSTAIPALHT